MARDDERTSSPSDSPDEARRIGAAAGVGGAAGAFAFMNRKRMKGAADAVSPATGRGVVLAIAWLVGFGVIVAVGRALAPDLAGAWGLIALVVMIAVAVGWRRVFPARRP